MKTKKLKCDYEDCSWEGTMRTRCKNDKSEYYRKFLCPTHSSKEKGAKKKSEQSKRTEQANKEKSERRLEYFNYHIPLVTVSEESGITIDNPSRLNVCHILPKSYFPSAEAILDNYMYLTGDEHTRIDILIFANRWEDIEKEFPKTWQLILLRLKKVIPLVKENHILLRNLKDYLEWKT